MKYLIGIDSGGTKSEIIAYDLEYNSIYRDIGGFGNPAVNLVETISNVSSLIQSCLNELGLKECLLIGIGMAAVETGNYVEVIQNHIKDKFIINTVVLNDAEMTCKAYLGDSDGILVVAGTGSSCYVLSSYKKEINKKISKYSLIEKDISATMGVINIYQHSEC